MINPHTGLPVEWTAASGPSLTFGGFSPTMLALYQKAGLWKPEYSAAVQDWGTDPSGRGLARQQWFESPEYRALMASLGGWQQGQARQDYNVFDLLQGPDGTLYQQSSQNQGPSFHSNDYRGMASVLLAGLGGAYAAGDIGAAGAAAGSGGEALSGMDLAADGLGGYGSLGASGGAAAGGTVAGGSGLKIGAGAQAATGFGTTAGTTAGTAGGLSTTAAAAPSWVGPVVSTVGGLASQYQQGQAAQKAAEIQAQAAKEGQATQLAMFEAMQKSLSPYVTAGNDAMAQQRALSGLDGPQAQQAAIAAIQSGPQFGAMQQLGENRIRANASASGGLRGGNFQAAMAQFSPQLLSSLIDQQYSRLGGLSQLGQASAAGVGSAGITTGQGVSNLQQQGGAAMAGGALAQGRVNAGYWGTIANGLGMYAGLSGGW
ncbi:MAG TPA: hypothetical protein PLL92_07175 [Alicycliphilus sp.]|nr:hypothetical protein [Alicycliphilus sp.]